MVIEINVDVNIVKSLRAFQCKNVIYRFILVYITAVSTGRLLFACYYRLWSFMYSLSCIYDFSFDQCSVVYFLLCISVSCLHLAGVLSVGNTIESDVTDLSDL